MFIKLDHISSLIILYLCVSVFFFLLDEGMNSSIKEMEAMILECAKLDREIDVFIDVVQHATAEVKHNDSQSDSSKGKTPFRSAFIH